MVIAIAIEFIGAFELEGLTTRDYVQWVIIIMLLYAKYTSIGHPDLTWWQGSRPPEAGKVVTKKDGEQVVTDNYEPPVLESVWAFYE